MTFIDVSVPLSAAVPTYPGNPQFELTPVKRLAAGDSANVSRLFLGTHTGTHIDAPRHFFDAGVGVDALPLELLIGPAQVVEVGGRAIEPEGLRHVDLSGTVRLLLKTRNSALWQSPEFSREYAFLTERAARHLVAQGVKVVGIDYLSVEEFRKPGAPAHHVLLGNGVIIIEGLNLSQVEPGVYEMICLPLRIVGGDGAPARVVLKR